MKFSLRFRRFFISLNCPDFFSLSFFPSLLFFIYYFFREADVVDYFFNLTSRVARPKRLCLSFLLLQNVPDNGAYPARRDNLTSLFFFLSELLFAHTNHINRILSLPRAEGVRARARKTPNSLSLSTDTITTRKVVYYICVHVCALSFFFSA